MGEAAVLLEGVSKTFGVGAAQVRALQGVSLEIPRGDFAVILGPSGSGKTTLMNLIGAIDVPSSGHVQVDGTKLDHLSEVERTEFRRRSVGFVFQFFNLIPTLTAQENVELVAELGGGDAAGRARQVLEKVGLGDRTHHYPAQLSGGEQQRIAVARALAKQAPVLLCDEATGELDFETGRRILSLLRRLNETEQRTVLLVTHNAAIADIADWVIHLRSGRLAEHHKNQHPADPQTLVW